MSASENAKIDFDNEYERPIVIAYSNTPKFRVGAKVYLNMGGTREGPFIVATVVPGKCTLCLADGTAVRNGEEVDPDYLEPA